MNNFKIITLATLLWTPAVFASSSDAEEESESSGTLAIAHHGSEAESSESDVRLALEPFDPSGVEKSAIPLAVIRHAAERKPKDLILAALAAVGIEDKDAESEEVLTTSCVNNALAVMCLLLGFEKTKQVSEATDKHGIFILQLPLPSQDATLILRTLGLFDGVIGSNLETRLAYLRLTDREKLEAVCRVEGGLSDYRKYAVDCLERVPYLKKAGEDALDAARRLILKSGYSFNFVVLNNLEKEILENCAKLTDEKAFAYFVAVRVSSNGGKMRMFEHAFVISQFMKLGEPYFLIYQGWIKEATLFQDLRSGMHALTGAFDLNRVKKFLRDFKKTYVEDYCRDNVRDLFFHEPDRGKWPKLVYLEGEMLFGTTVIYVTCPYNPEDAPKHLADLCAFNIKTRK